MKIFTAHGYRVNIKLSAKINIFAYIVASVLLFSCLIGCQEQPLGDAEQPQPSTSNA